jgi:hypothetical protein
LLSTQAKLGQARRTLELLSIITGPIRALLFIQSLSSQLPFPLSVKVVLQRRGLPILPLSRQAVNDLNGEQWQQAEDLVQQFKGLRNDLGIPSLL